MEILIVFGMADFVGMYSALITLPKIICMADSLNQHNETGDTLRAEIDSLLAAQMSEPIRTVAGMEDKYFYFIAIVVFVLLGFILVDRLIFNKTILSFKKDLKELAKMKGDFVRLATLLQTEMQNRHRVISSNNSESDSRPFNSTDTQILIPQKELRRLRALERIYQDNAEGMSGKKTNLLDEG